MVPFRTAGRRTVGIDAVGTHPAAGIDPDRFPVTRIEVLDFVGDLFTGAPVPRADLLDAARAAGARDALLRRLGADLPDRPLGTVDELWRHVDVPEDLAAAGL